MDETVLLRFLNNGLINVGGDDSKLEKLTQAAGDLAGVLKKTPSKALSFSLIAFDPEAPDEDPVVVEALAALQNRWTTYRNTFSSTPIAVIRAMLLDALVQAATEDDRVGVCFVASARNALPLMRADNERAIWANVVADIEKQIDARAEAEWTTPASITVPALSYEVPEIEAPSVTAGRTAKDSLLKGLYEAVGPHYNDPQQGNVATNGNPHNPAQAAQWAGEFGRRAAGTIANAIEDAIAKTEIHQPDLAKLFQQLATGVSTHVDETLKAVSAATVGLQRRTNLLWWKEALFSPSARKSYRDLPVTVAAAQMAFDLYNEVPLFSPASVSAFLGEAVLRLPTAVSGEDHLIRELVGEAQDHASLEPLRAASAQLLDAPNGRGPLLALIGHADHSDSRSETAFQLLTGVHAEARLSTAAWAGWIFRELQAAKAAFDGSPAKRRSKRN